MKNQLVFICFILSSLAGWSQPALPVPATPIKTNQNVNLEWDASPTTNATGYIIRRGIRSGVYDQQITVNGRLNTTLTWSNAPVGVTNYFMATAFNASGLESDPSNELSVILERRPAAPLMRTAVPITVMIKSSDGRLRLSVGPYYVVTEGTNDAFRAELAIGRDTVPLLLSR